MAIVGLDFVSDIIDLLKEKWDESRGGSIPNMTPQWEIKQVGLAATQYDEVIVSHDSEETDIFSLNEGWERAEQFTWMHEVSASIDIRTGQSTERIVQLTNEIVRIIKENVLLNINNREYIHFLPDGVTNLNEQYRNLYRYMVSVSATYFNP